MKHQTFSDEIIRLSIIGENPWWQDGKISPYYKVLKKRAFFKLFIPMLDLQIDSRIVVLMGQKRVGKTTLLYQAIDFLLQKGIAPAQIAFLSVENPVFYQYDLMEITELLIETSRMDLQKNGYIVFDKIQYFPKWELVVQEIARRFPLTKFVISGSAADLKLQGRNMNPQHFNYFRLPNFTFYEYIEFKEAELLLDWDEENCNEADIEKLNAYFLDYIAFGGHPETLLSDTPQRDMGRFLRSAVFSRILLRGFPSLYGIRDVRTVNWFFTYLLLHSGEPTSYKILEAETDIDKNEIAKYLDFLKAVFLIKIVSEFEPAPENTDEVFKIYISNPSYRIAYFNLPEDNPQLLNYMVETAIITQWEHLADMDLLFVRHLDNNHSLLGKVGDKIDWLTRIDFSNELYEKPETLLEVQKIANKEGILFPLITTRTKLGIEERDGVLYHFQPASLYCYSIGRHIIESRLTDYV